MQPNSRNGLTLDVATDMVGTPLARNIDILTPVLYPPIKLHEVVYNNRIVPAAWFYKFGSLYLNQRGFSSDIRVNGVYSAQSIRLYKEEIEHILSDLPLSLEAAYGMVDLFIFNTKIVHDFNILHNSDYFLGCSPFIKDYSYEGYALGFLDQFARNVTQMIEHDFWHENFSPQNTTIGAEVGDFDAFSYVSPDRSWILSWDDGQRLSPAPFTKGEQKEKSFQVFEDGYKITAFMSALYPSSPSLQIRNLTFDWQV